MKKIKSNFAIVDITYGRKGVKKIVDSGGRIKVFIEGEIYCVHSNDDGLSREFGVDVTNIKIKETNDG